MKSAIIIAVFAAVGLLDVRISHEANLQVVVTHSEATRSPFVVGEMQFDQDFQAHYWQSDYVPPRIRPTSGQGYICGFCVYLGGIYWIMSGAEHTIYWRWKIHDHDPAVQAQIQSQWNYVKSHYRPTQLSSADPAVNGGIINVSDDAAWALRFLVEVHEATGDPQALADAQGLLTSTQSYFADPNHSGCGILYATASQDPSKQNQSSLYETVTALSALYLYSKTDLPQYLTYAKGVWNWINSPCAQHPFGVYFAGADLDPTHACYKQGIQCATPNNITFAGPGGSFVDSASFIGGVMGTLTLGARLYAITETASYLRTINHVLSAMLQPRTFLRPGSNVGLSGTVLLNDRDAFEDGAFGQEFADQVLSNSRVDPSNAFKATFAKTAQSIINSRVSLPFDPAGSAGYYSPDWSGPEGSSHATRAAQGLASNPAITATASITAATLKVTAVSGGTIMVGQRIAGLGITPGTYISGSGGTGTYTVTPSQTVESETVTIGHNITDYCCNGMAEANQSQTTASQGGMIQGAALLAIKGLVK